MSSDILDGDLCKKISFIFTFSFFLVFKHDFIRCVDFTRIAVSNTASDNVTKWATHKIFNTHSLYSCVHFIIKIDEIFSVNDGFNTI